MKQILLKYTGVWIILNTFLVACVVSKVRPITPAETGSQLSASPVTIFLLERDLPKEIERLGVVSIAVNERASLGVDDQVKQQLRKDCQRLGANGAYRVNDGTYYPIIVSYLVFKYKK